MQQCYRTFTLQSLRTGPLVIAEKISEHKKLLEEAEKNFTRSVDRLVFFWSFGVSVFVGIFSGIIFNNIYIGLILFVLITVGTFFIGRIPLIKNRLRISNRYAPQVKQIIQSRAAIKELHDKARAYQKHLEPSGGPGLIAIFADVLLHEYYPSFFPLDDRIRIVDLSTQGRGTEIDIFDYGRIIIELKTCELNDYTDTDNLISQVPSQNKCNAAIAYGKIIATGTSKVNEDSIRFAAIIGLNAWLLYEMQGRPLTWSSYETERWIIIKKIFKEAIVINTLGLAKSISEYNEIERKNNRNQF